VEKEVEIEGKKRKIKIPAGIDEGLRINFNDFILSVNVKPHKIFERDGENIFVKLAIPYSLATLGGTVEAPTIDGGVKIRIKAGTQSGTMIRLRGKGAPRIRGRGRGDEYVRVLVAVPEKLTREQKKIIEKIKKKGL
jgi:molecular chaperone DnaJ